MTTRRVILFIAALTWLFLTYAGSGLSRPFTRGADIAGWTASTAANARAINVSDRWLPNGVGQPLAELDPLENLLYLHQSPLPYWITAAVFAVTGATETVTRLIPLLFTLGAGLLLYRLLTRLWDPRVGLLALGAFWLNPTTVTFAMSNNHIVIAQFTVLLALSAWVGAAARELRRFAYPIAVACTLLAMWTYWYAYFLPLFFALAEARWTAPGARSYRRMVVWLALPALSIAAHLLLYYAAYPPGPAELLSTVMNRSGLEAGGWKPLRTVRDLSLELSQLWQVGFIVLGLAFLGTRLMRDSAPLRTEQRVILLSLAGAPLLYWIFMARIAATEPMFNLVLIAPFIAAIFAIGAVEVLGPRLVVLAVPVLVLSVGQIAVQHDAWQLRLYSHKAQEAVHISKMVRNMTREGDVLIEDGSNIGPGVLAYYALGRTVIHSENFLVRPRRTAAEYVSHVLRKLAPQRSVYLVTTADRLKVSDFVAQLTARGYEILAPVEISDWRIMKIKKRG